MEVNDISRRHVLRRTAAAAGAALAATTLLDSARPAFATGDDNGLAGAWNLDRSDPSIGATSRGIWTFSPGGVVHYQDIYPLNPLLHGAWRGSPNRRFRYEMWAGLADPVTGAPITSRVAGSGTWRRNDTLQTSYTVTIFDGPTEAQLFQYDGTATGARLAA